MEDGLLDLLNYYMLYGKEQIMANPKALEMLFSIADQAIYAEGET